MWWSTVVVLNAGAKKNLKISIDPVRQTDWLANKRFMDFKVKTLLGLDRGNHVIVITSGYVNIKGFEYIFSQIINETSPLLDCKVIVDLQGSTIKFLLSDVTAFLESIDLETWPRNNKLALVSSPETEQYQQLVMLGDGLKKRLLNVSVFYDTKEGLTWLSDLR
jgi:hypothetical protein